MSKKQTLETIAQSLQNVTTLETQNADSKDFHELSVWELKRVLEEAYEAGRNSVR